jgi:hypothetical protein
MTPTVPRASTAIAGWNANAETPGSVVGPLQVTPPSLDLTMSISPVVGELAWSQAT